MDYKLSENFRGGVFPNEETFNKIYERYLESQPQASESVRNAYNKMGEWFELYLCYVQEDLFRHAYQCGYEDGRRGCTET